MNYLPIPDFVFARVTEIDADFLKKQNILALLCDIDNTLSPYEEAVPNAEICAWISELQRNGISLALISNNKAARVEAYNKLLGLPAYPDAHKPSKKCYLAAAGALGTPTASCAVLGDQLLTDVWAAKRLGVRSLVVPPIKDKKTLFFRFKRLLEVPFMKAYYRREKKRAAKEGTSKHEQ